MIDLITLHTQWHGDWNHISSEALEKRRAAFEKTSHIERLMLTNAIYAARAGRKRLVEKFAYGFADPLYLDSSVAATPDVSRLLNIAETAMNMRRPDAQLWFEALSLFDQAMAIIVIEREEPIESLGRTMDSLIDLLGGKLFNKGYRKCDFYAYHDPDADYVVHSGNVGIGTHLNRPGMSRRKITLTCRHIKRGSIAYLHHRIKDPFWTWLKMQCQLQQARKDNPFEVSDRCALMFVVPSRSDILSTAKRILVMLEREGGHVTEPLKSNYDIDTAVDRTNHISSSDFKFAKAQVFWSGTDIEFQFMTFEDYFSSLRALSIVNHELYKLQQAMFHFFPLLWPHEHYGVNWSNPNVIGQMRARKIAQLGWRVNIPHA